MIKVIEACHGHFVVLRFNANDTQEKASQSVCTCVCLCVSLCITSMHSLSVLLASIGRA